MQSPRFGKNLFALAGSIKLKHEALRYTLGKQRRYRVAHLPITRMSLAPPSWLLGEDPAYRRLRIRSGRGRIAIGKFAHRERASYVVMVDTI